ADPRHAALRGLTERLRSSHPEGLRHRQRRAGVVVLVVRAAPAAEDAVLVLHALQVEQAVLHRLLERTVLLGEAGAEEAEQRETGHADVVGRLAAAVALVLPALRVEAVAVPAPVGRLVVREPAQRGDGRMLDVVLRVAARHARTLAAGTVAAGTAAAETAAGEGRDAVADVAHESGPDRRAARHAARQILQRRRIGIQEPRVER